MALRRVPLAWRSITHDRTRFVQSVAGIMFSAVLMFMQLGFLNAVFDSQVELIRRFHADLILTNRSKHHLGIYEPFARRRLEQVLAVKGVRGAYPVYMEVDRSFWRNPETHESHPIRVIGMRLDDPILPSLVGFPAALRNQDSVLIDERSKSFFGPLKAGVDTELGGQLVHVVGTFALGTDFDSDGTVIMTDSNFLKYFPERQTSGSGTARVELGLIQIEPGLALASMQDAIAKVLPDDVRVWTKSALIDQEVDFWQKYTPVGFIFDLGLAVGFVVGIVICSQILYTSVVDRMPLFGTLKAIGYTNGYLVRLVAGEAALLSMVAFVPGVIVAAGLYRLLASMIGLEMFLNLQRILLVMSFTLGMSMVAAFIALRKALTADPAEVFK